MTREELESLQESWDFEAKLAGGRDGRGAVPVSMWPTYVAMANTEGGCIVLGARELPDHSLELVGIADIEKVERDLWSTLEDPKKVSANVLARNDVQRVDVDGKTLLLIRVPRAGRGVRPLYVNGSIDAGTFVRVHEGDHHVRPDVAHRMLAERTPDQDSRTVVELGLDALHTPSVRKYREMLAARRPDHPFLGHGDPDFLRSIGAAGVDRARGGTIHPTWSGLWMLGEESAIREALPYWHLSYKEVPMDLDEGPRWVDRIHLDGTWNGNLLEFYLRVIGKLHADLKTPFTLEARQFRRDETEVHAAVREAFVNTLVHADHRGTTGIRIIRRGAGFEFVNPGALLVTPEQVWRGGISEPRNPTLQRLFGLLNLGEREGSGGPAMARAWRAQHWRAPRIWTDVEHMETHLELRLESLLPESAVTALVDRFGDRFTTLDELGRLILAVAESEGGIEHARVRQLSAAHSRDITLKLQELVRSRLLDSSGERRATRYVVVAEQVQPSSWPQQGLPGLADRTEPGSIPQSIHQSIPQSIHQSIHQSRPDIAATRWARADAVRRAILDFCSEFKTIGEIAAAIGRAPTTIQQNYIPDLVAEGLLERRFPDQPRHPGQAYRSTARGGP